MICPFFFEGSYGLQDANAWIDAHIWLCRNRKYMYIDIET